MTFDLNNLKNKNMNRFSSPLLRLKQPLLPLSAASSTTTPISGSTSTTTGITTPSILYPKRNLECFQSQEDQVSPLIELTHLMMFNNDIIFIFWMLNFHKSRYFEQAWTFDAIKFFYILVIPSNFVWTPSSHSFSLCSFMCIFWNQLWKNYS